MNIWMLVTIAYRPRDAFLSPVLFLYGTAVLVVCAAIYHLSRMRIFHQNVAELGIGRELSWSRSDHPGR
jgi:hypothetical protein